MDVEGRAMQEQLPRAIFNTAQGAVAREAEGRMPGVILPPPPVNLRVERFW